MNVIILAAAYATMASTHTVAPVKVNVNAKNGDTISGERSFRVTVTASNPVTGVEFYAGSELKDKDTSTPYEFTYDTLLDSDGKITLKFRAFTTEGEEGSATVNLTIDNGMGKGVDFHLGAARDALTESNWEVAIKSARVALKIDAKNNEARYLLARAYMGQGKLDKAQKFVEDAAEAQPNDPKVSELLTAIRLRQAFATVNRPGSDRTEVLNGMLESYRGAIAARQKTVDALVEAVGAPSATNLVAYADANLRAGRYGAVVSALEGPFQADQRNVDIGNRLAYAQLRALRTQDALTTLTQVKKFGQPNAFTYAELAIALAEADNGSGSDDALKDALLAGSDDPSVLSAQAFIALKFVRRKVGTNTRLFLNYDDATGMDAAAKLESRQVLKSSLDQLLQDSGNRTEVLTYASALNNRLDEYTKGQSYFERAVLADPLNADAFIEQANRSIALALRGTPSQEELDQRYDTARIHFQAALEARPSSAEALTGLCLVASLQGKHQDAVKWGEAAVRAAPEYAAGQIALGAVYTHAAIAWRAEADRIRKSNNDAGTTNADRQANELKARDLESESVRVTAQARESVRKASSLDKRIEGVELTAPKSAWRYFYAGGRTPMLPLPR